MAEWQGAPAPEEGSVATATAPVLQRSAAFPRVNLLPPAIAAEARVRRAKLVLVGGAAIAAALIGGMYVMAQNDVASAQDSLDTAQAQATKLQAEVATYAEVPQVYAQVSAAQAQLVTAMGNEVRWSYLLNDIALTIPKNVSLVTYHGELAPPPAAPVTPAAAPATDGTTTAAAPAPAPAGPLGTVQYTGEASGYKAIASWLDSQAKQLTFSDTYLTAATRKDATDGTPSSVDWTSTANLTDKALSHRFDGTGK
jgi:hypothetical protein